MKQTVLAAACSALCMLFWHMCCLLPGSGNLYSAIYLPIQLCAICCGVGSGLLCAVVGVLLPAVFGAVPNAILLPSVLVENLILTLYSGIVLRRMVQNGSREKLLPGLLLCFFLSRLGGGAAAIFLYLPIPKVIPSVLMMTAYLAAGMPGLLISLVIFPKIISSLSDSGMLPVAETANSLLITATVKMREETDSDDTAAQPAAETDTADTPETKATEPARESAVKTSC